MGDRENNVNILRDENNRANENQADISNEQRMENARANSDSTQYTSKILPDLPNSPVISNEQVLKAGKKANYLDATLIDFFSSIDGDRYLSKDTQSRPVHIIADFNYMPLSDDLESATENEGQRDSQVAKSWRRNADARFWRDWVGNCLILENFLGPERPGDFDGRTYAKIGNSGEFDLTKIGLDIDSRMLENFSESNEQFLDELGSVLSFTLDLYGKIFKADEAILQSAVASPRHPSYIKSDFLQSYSEFLQINFGSIRGDQNSEIADFYRRFVDFTKQLKVPEIYHDLSASEDSLCYNFKFSDLNGEDKSFTIDSPEKFSYIVKGVAESIRNINAYITDRKFIYNKGDEQDQNHGDFRKYSDASSIETYTNSVDQNIYGPALDIRRNLIDMVATSKGANKRDISNPESVEGKYVLSKGRSVENKISDTASDDVQKLLARTLVIENNKKAITISPYLYQDFVEDINSRSIHYVTLRDILSFKKNQLFSIYSNLFSGASDREIRDSIEQLKTFPFENGPANFSALVEELQVSLAGVTQEDEQSLKVGLVLSDPRNIVSHITKRRVGRYLYDTSLLISHYCHAGSSVSNSKLINYKIGFYNEANRDAVAQSLLGSSRRANDVDTLTQSHVSQGTPAVYANKGPTLGISNELDNESRSLINSSVLKMAADSDPRLIRKYIFLLVISQLSKVDFNSRANSPYFCNTAEDSPNYEAGTKREFKFSDTANTLYSVYLEKIKRADFKSDRKNPQDEYFAGRNNFSAIPLDDVEDLLNTYNSQIIDRALDPNSSMVSGLISDISDLKDRVSSLPNSIESGFLDYKRRVTQVVSRVAGSPTAEGFHEKVSQFFGKIDSNTDYSHVLLDFLYTAEGGYNPGAEESKYSYQTAVMRDVEGGGQITQSAGTSRLSRPTEFQRRNGDYKIAGVRGLAAGGSRERPGFSALDTSGGFKNRTINSLKKQLLGFDRNNNFLIMLSESICAQLFFGYPEIDKFERNEGFSMFQDNFRGIFNYLGLVSRDPSRNRNEHTVNADKEKLFDVVWNYCKIASALVEELPKVKLKFFLTEGAGIEAELKSGNRFYNPTDLLSKQGHMFNALASAEGSLRSYRTSEGTATELANSVNELAIKANQYFKIAESMLAKDPVFSLAILPHENPRDEWAVFSQHSRTGFLPHVTINNPFARQNLAIYGDASFQNPDNYQIPYSEESTERTRFLYENVGYSPRENYNSYMFGSIPNVVNYNRSLDFLRDRRHQSAAWYSSLQNSDLENPDTYFGFSIKKLYIYGDAAKAAGGTNYDQKDNPNHPEYVFDNNISNSLAQKLQQHYNVNLGMIPPSWYSKLISKMPVISDVNNSVLDLRVNTGGIFQQSIEEETNGWLKVMFLENPVAKYENKVSVTIELKKREYIFPIGLQAQPTGASFLYTTRHNGKQARIRLPANNPYFTEELANNDRDIATAPQRIRFWSNRVGGGRDYRGPDEFWETLSGNIRWLHNRNFRGSFGELVNIGRYKPYSPLDSEPQQPYIRNELGVYNDERDGTGLGPTDVNEIVVEDTARRGSHDSAGKLRAPFLTADLYLGLARLDNGSGDFNGLGRALVEGNDQFEQQYYYALRLFSQMREDPQSSDWQHQAWDWRREGTSLSEKGYVSPLSFSVEGRGMHVEGSNLVPGWIAEQLHKGTTSVQAIREESTFRESYVLDTSHGVSALNYTDTILRRVGATGLNTRESAHASNAPSTFARSLLLGLRNEYVGYGQFLNTPHQQKYGGHAGYYVSVEGADMDGGNPNARHEWWLDNFYINDGDALPLGEPPEPPISGRMYKIKDLYYPDILYLNRSSNSDKFYNETSSREEAAAWLVHHDANFRRDLRDGNVQDPTGVAYKKTYINERSNSSRTVYPMFDEEGGLFRKVTVVNLSGTLTLEGGFAQQPTFYQDRGGIMGELDPEGNNGINYADFQPIENYLVPWGAYAQKFLNSDPAPGDSRVYEHPEWNPTYDTITREDYDNDGFVRDGKKRMWSQWLEMEVRNKLYEESKPRAEAYFRRVKTIIDRYNSNNNVGATEARCNRAAIHYLPYVDFYKCQFPVFRITVKREFKEEFKPAAFHIDPNWSMISSLDDAANAGAWGDRTTVAQIANLDSLEDQYLQYLQVQKNYLDMYSLTFEGSMLSYSQDLMSVNSEASGANRSNVIKKAAERRKQMMRTGFMSVTPELLDNYAAVRDLVNRYRNAVNLGDHAFAWNMPNDRIRDSKRITPPFKLSPIGLMQDPDLVNLPRGEKGPQTIMKHYSISAFKQLEKVLFDKGIISKKGTRVCFVAVESGQMENVLGSASDLQSFSEDYVNFEKWKSDTNYQFKTPSVFSGTKFEIELELFDYFRPWLRFKFQPQGRESQDAKMVFPRRKLTSLGAGAGYVPTRTTQNHVSTFLARAASSEMVEFLTNVKFGLREGIASSKSPGSFYEHGREGHNLLATSFFLKVYALMVMGMNTFEHTIPKVSNISPIGDYEEPEQGSLPEERNYQEDLKNNLKEIFQKFKDAGSESEISHLLKYFFDRKRIAELQNPTFVHFDSAGRQDLVRFGSKDALLSENSVDFDQNLFFPFRMEDPINKSSVRASEILSSVNETFSTVEEFFDNFKYGFCFDNIVALTYKMSDFVLENKARMIFDEEEFDIPNDVPTQADGSYGDFGKIKRDLFYVDDQTGRIKGSTLYPLTVRARMKKVGES